MLQHVPFNLHHPGKLLALWLVLFILGISRRNVWLTASSGFAIISALVSWQYGYTLSPLSLRLADACSFWFGLLSFGIFLGAMIRDRRNMAS